MNNVVSYSKRLLFVDDEDSIRAMLPLILQGHGFEVKTAASVPEALQEIQSSKFDVLLSDLNIGEPGDGYEVIRAVRQANPGCVAIILTAYPYVEGALESIRHEIDDYFAKPADIDALIATLQKRLAARLPY